jgi:Cys-tRNA(Pro)/Cys-tRNA(Cys) deacylase
MAGRETPATRAARAAGVAYTVHEYRHDPRAASYAGEAAEALGLDPRRVLKTFVSAGRRGLEIELAPDDLVALTGAAVRPLCRA